VKGKREKVKVLRYFFCASRCRATVVRSLLIMRLISVASFSALCAVSAVM